MQCPLVPSLLQAADATDRGKSLYDWLIDMYVDFGYYKEYLLNVTKRFNRANRRLKR